MGRLGNICSIPLGQVPESITGEAPRLDVDYAMTQYASTGGRIQSTEILVVGAAEEVGGEPAEDYQYCEIGHIDNMGRVSPYCVQQHGTGDGVEFEKQTDRIRKKVVKGDVVRYNAPTVLVPKTRPYLGKFAIITGAEDICFTKALIPLVPAGRIQAECEQYDAGRQFETLVPCCLLFLALKGGLRNWLSSLARWGKSYPVVDAADIVGATITEHDVEEVLNHKQVERARKMAKSLSVRDACDAEIVRILQEG